MASFFASRNYPLSTQTISFMQYLKRTSTTILHGLSMNLRFIKPYETLP